MLYTNMISELTLGEKMKEAVLPDDVDFLGLSVHPSFYSALIVTALLLVAALIIRIFVIPKFTKVPGKFQALLEKFVEFFANLANEKCHEKNAYIGPYVFASGTFIFFGTAIEMIGFTPVFGDINACIALGLCAFGSIFCVAVRTNGGKGVINALKDFSLPISMSFRLFGAMLSGVLVNELVFNFIFLSFGVPIFVYVLFTLLHAIIQTYVYTMLVSIFFGENTERKPKKAKRNKANRVQA